MDDSVTLFNEYSISPHTAMAHVFEMVDDGGRMLFQALTLKSNFSKYSYKLQNF